MSLDPEKIPLIPLQPQTDFFSRNKDVWADELVNASTPDEQRAAMKAIINANLVINSLTGRQIYLDYQQAKEQNVRSN